MNKLCFGSTASVATRLREHSSLCVMKQSLTQPVPYTLRPLDPHPFSRAFCHVGQELARQGDAARAEAAKKSLAPRI